MKYEVIADTVCEKKNIESYLITFLSNVLLYTVKFGPLLRKLGNRPNINNCIYSDFDSNVTQGLVTRLGRQAWPRRSESESDTFQLTYNTLSWKFPSWGFQDNLIDSSIILRFFSINM